ncbi:MAG TPA: hypothetical protein VHP37_29835 [Burkholderiales bacterium]|nr:hypothetical protein [Burkholderiales bacterium]
MSKAKIAAALAVAASVASGCASVANTASSEIAGVGGAAVASAITSNGAAATGIGLGVQAATRAGLQYAQRRVHDSVQNEIARAAGPLEVGVVGHWSIDPAGALERKQQGRVTVSRVISVTDLQCKETVFSVDTVEKDVPKAAFYVAIVCRDGEQWKWASAEPATARWDGLQ